MNAVFLAIMLATAMPHGADAVGAKAKAGAEWGLSANPIRRVVTMLQMMQKKVEAEGAKEAELFEKFMCYCKAGTASLTDSINDAEDKIPQLESDIKETESLQKKLEGDLVTHKADREEATAAIAKAKMIREKEAKAFEAESGEEKSNLAAIGKAIPAIEKGMAGEFLQTDSAQHLREMLSAVSTDMLSPSDHDLLAVFLEGRQGYAPAGGEIVGILKQMKDTMEKDLAELVGEEEAAVKDFDSTVAAKEKEIAAATKAIEEKIARLGEASVSIVNLKEDLEDTSESLAEDKKMLAELEKNCAHKKKEYEAYEKTHSMELIAIADTIKLLNDDDALDLFKKTLPSAASFVQMGTGTAMEVKSQALATLRAALRRAGKRAPRDYRLNFLALAMQGKATGFDKVIKMVDDMVVILGKEQVDDDKKKAYCEGEIDKTEDEVKSLTVTISDMEAAIEEAKDAMGVIVDEIKTITKGLADLDQEVAKATTQRKQENAEFTETLAANNAAMQLIEMAKNRLAKFYNPAVYKAPPKRSALLSEEERITLNMGGTLAPTNPPAFIDESDGDVDFVQVHARMQTRTRQNLGSNSLDEWLSGGPPALPQTFAKYQKASEEAGGVTAMMDMMKADLAKEIQEMEFAEKDAQEEYEVMVKTAAEKRVTDLKSIEQKEAARAKAEEELLKQGKDLKLRNEEKTDTMQALMDLHGECDWLLGEYEARKEARNNEIEALKKAKAVLSGADYSLLQMGTHHRHLRRSHA